MPTRLALLLDFDGTVVRPDTIRLLAELGMGPLRARQLSREVDRGRVTVRDAIEQMVASVTASREIAFGFLDARVRVDPGFAPLLEWARGAGVETRLVSGGLLPVIHHLLGPLAEGLPILANDLVVESEAGGSARWRVVFRDAGPVEAGKRRTVEALLAAGRPVVYVGDGAGDVEAASIVAVAGRSRGPTLGSAVFARDHLADTLVASALPFTRFETLHDVRSALAGG